MAARPGRRLAALLGLIGAAALVAVPAGPALLHAAAGDTRLPAGDAAIPQPLAQAVRSVAFLDIPPAQPGALGDGGTAILVSDCLMLTANHVFEALAAGNNAVTLRVRFPALRGDADGEVKAFTARLESRPSGLWRDPVSDDWALLRLTESPGLPPLALAPASCCGWQSLPAPAAIAGFPADKFDARSPAMWIDPDCAITRRLPIPVFATDCQATSGNSGGPVLVMAEGGWKLAALLTRAPPPRRQGLSVGQTAYALAVEGRIARAIARASKQACVAEP
ncbi:MAG: trypsin-like peptidase domain-containing protein [Porphyrobacter sp.]|nr:trypsin-like peptidase domain-containing protein [Porphyrobacter sp.]